jgi:hypothetical protein
MLLRYHWGLGVGHTYSHVQGSASHEAESMVASDSRASLGGFDDLENEHSIFELDALEWRFLDTVEAEDGASDEHSTGNVSDPAFADASTSLTHGFDDLGVGSLADFEVLELEIDELELDDGSDSGSDSDSDASVMYGMYGSDWADDGDESD